MKIFAILAAYFVLASGLSTREVWPAGKEFLYQYKARVVAGIPAIKQQLTGFGIKSIVKLQVVSPNTILVKMTELESGQVNNVVPQAAPEVYRAAPGFNWSPMSGEAEQVLKVPFKINLRNGLVTSLDVVESEPTWSINIKKGFASQINVNLQQTNRIPFQLRLTKKYEDKSFRHLRTPSAEDRFFAVEEDAMGGLCKTAYTVVPLENYIATREELDLPREILLEAVSEPEGSRPYIITKIRDFDECDRQPSWVHMNSKDITEEPCNPANAMCHKFSSRTSISRFLVRKSPSGHHMRVERVWGENEFIVKPHGVVTERLWSVSNQTLVLLNERPISSRINVPSEKLTSTNLRFEFPIPESESIENPRLNEDPTFQGLRLPQRQTIGEVKEKTAERRAQKANGGRAGKYGSGKLYGSRPYSKTIEEEEEEEEQQEVEKMKMVGKKSYGSSVKYGSKYGSRYGGSKYGSSKYPRSRTEDTLGSKKEYVNRRNKYREEGGDTSSESSDEKVQNDYEDEESEPEPGMDYDNEYFRRDVEDESERYYDTRVLRSEYKLDLRRYYPSLKRACSYISPHTAARALRGSNVKAQIQELIHEVVSEISNFEDLAEKESALKVLQVARACTVLSYDEIKQVYHSIVSSGSSPENVKTKKALMLDAMAMAGTHPAIMVIRDLVAKGEVKGELAAQVISTIPLSVKVITPELISELITLVQSPQVRPSSQPHGTHQVWITTMLAIGNMINFGCVSPRTKNFNFPKEPRGAPLCSKNDPVITQEFIPMLKNGLEKSEGKLWKKIVFLHALGNVGHPQVLPVLEACITGQICQDPQIRTKAVNALTRITRIAPSKVYKVLRPVYANQKVHYAIRMAAFQTLLYCKPPPAFFTAAATDTWFEPSQQVGSFVYSTLANFANNTLPVYQNISRMARMALPLAKKYKLGAQYSKNIILSNYVPEDTLGSFLHTTILGSTKSLIPRFFYTRLINRAGGFNLDVLQTGFYAQGVQGVLNKIWHALSPVSSKEEIFSAWSRISESWHRSEEPLGVIARELNLKLRKDEPMNVMAWYKVYGGMERLFTLNYQTLLEFVNEVSPSFTAGKVGVNMKVNYQKAFNPRSITVILPTDMGVPVYFSKKAPVLVSVRGHINIQGDMPSLRHKTLTETADVDIDLRPVVSQNILLEMGVICPVTQQSYIAGVNTHNLLSLPVKTKVHLNIPAKELSFEMAPSSGPLPNKISLVHTHQRPFTCIKHLGDFMPVNKVPTIKYMRVVAEPHYNETIVGEDTLGIPIKITSRVDQPFSGLIARYKRMLKQNPVTAISFMNVPHTLRAFEYRITVDSSMAQTKKVVGKISLSTSASESPIFSMEPESDLESKEYSIRSEHYPETQQDLLSFLKNPSEYWQQESEEPLGYIPSIVGTPSRLNRKGGWSYQQKYLPEDIEEEEESESAGENVEFSTKNEGKTIILHGRVEMQGPVPRVIRASILSSSTPDDSIRKISAQFEKEGGVHSSPYKAFATALLQYPRMPNTPIRQALLQTDMTSLACITARFGRNTEHVVKAKVIMTRTGKQRRIAEESQAAKRCQADEAKGLRYSASCLHARKQATTLNKYVIDISSQNLPKSFLNATYMADSYLKYALFPHLSVDPTARHHNPQNRLRVILNVDSPQPSHPYPVVDILTSKPHENAHFKSVKVPPFVEAIFPISARIPIVTKALNNYLGWKYIPMCKVGHESIQTFDNVTIHYPLPECYHLIAKDCSHPSGISVLAKHISQGQKVVKIVLPLLQKEIILAPTESTSRARPAIAVKINGSPLSPLRRHQTHEFRVQGQVALKITKLGDAEVKVDAVGRGIQVISDGMHVRVVASNMLRGRLCGLCGDFNGEKMAELKGPRGCVHISPLTFGRSYALPSEGCSSLQKIEPAELLRQLEKKEWTMYETAAEAELTALASRHIQSCIPEEYEPVGESVSPSSVSTRRYITEEEDEQSPLSRQIREEEEEVFSPWQKFSQGGGSHGEGHWEPRSESSRPCVRYVTKVVTQGDKTCFSVKPVPECNLNCKPVNIISKPIPFHCKKTSEVDDSHLASARFRIVEEFLGMPENMSSDLSIPDSCEMLTV